jgi:glycine/D-amino acid oxidase-like deaminating enzyme
VETTHGAVRARAVVNATEAHTGGILANFLTPYPSLIRAHKSQAMYARGRPDAMVPGMGVLGPLGWFHPRREGGFLFGSDNVRIPLHQVEGNDPSRFITLFMCSEATRLWPPDSFTVVHEWTGTVGLAPDKFPVVGELSVPGLWTLGGFAGAGSAAAFSAGLHVVNGILGDESRPNYHPERFLSPDRFRSWARYGVAPLVY